MIFYNIANALIQTEFDMGEFVFSDILGFSKKTAKRYANDSMSVDSRQFNQFKNRLMNIVESEKDPLNQLLAAEMLNVTDAIVLEKPFVFAGSRDACERRVLLESNNLGIPIDDLDLGDVSWHYSMSFIDAVSLPYRTYSPNTDFNALLYSQFPYSKYTKNDIDNFIKASQQENGIQKQDEDAIEIIVDAYIAVISAIYLDVKRLNESIYGTGMDFWPGFFDGAWLAKNAKAYFFVHIRERSKKTTYDRFYQELASSLFTKLDYDSVKTNYKRWCKTGSLNKEQWKCFAGTDDLLSEEYLLIRLKFSIAVLFQALKDLINNTNLDFSLDNFNTALINWCELIESEFPLGRWQPFQAAE